DIAWARRVRGGSPGSGLPGDDGRGDSGSLRPPARGVAPAGRAPEAGGLHQRGDRRAPRVRRAERGTQAGADPAALDSQGRPGMSIRMEPTPDPWTPTRAGHIDIACDLFEVQWRAGRRPRIEDFLKEPGAAEAGPILLRELLALELELRARAGEQPGREEYAA